MMICGQTLPGGGLRPVVELLTERNPSGSKII